MMAATAAFAQQTAPAPTEPQNNVPAQQQEGQHGRHHTFDAHKAAQHMGKKLGLSADQTARLEPILSDNQQKIKALRSDSSLTHDQRREQMRAIHKDMQTQLSSVLTPDQMQQLRSMRRGQHDRPHGSPEQAPDSATPPSAS